MEAEAAAEGCNITTNPKRSNHTPERAQHNPSRDRVIIGIESFRRRTRRARSKGPTHHTEVQGRRWVRAQKRAREGLANATRQQPKQQPCGMSGCAHTSLFTLRTVSRQRRYNSQPRALRQCWAASGRLAERANVRSPRPTTQGRIPAARSLIALR